jgi:rhodanese-related sulfurtransferase
MLQQLFHRMQTAVARVPEIGVAELQQRLQAGEELILLDVRTPPEYAQEGHIAGARLLPLSSLRQRSRELPQDRPIVCVCRSGARSMAACEQLAALGFSNVANLAGGMLAWRRAGLPAGS